MAAPRLRDAGLPQPRLRTAYTEMLLVMRKLFQKCRLVHADLSEYNILYHKVRRGGGTKRARAREKEVVYAPIYLHVLLSDSFLHGWCLDWPLGDRGRGWSYSWPGRRVEACVGDGGLEDH